MYKMSSNYLGDTPFSNTFIYIPNNQKEDAILFDINSFGSVQLRNSDELRQMFEDDGLEDIMNHPGGIIDEGYFDEYDQVDALWDAMKEEEYDENVQINDDLIIQIEQKLSRLEKLEAEKEVWDRQRLRLAQLEEEKKIWDDLKMTLGLRR